MSFVELEARLKSGGVRYYTRGSGRPLLWLHSAYGVRVSAGIDRLAASARLYLPVIPGFDGAPVHDRLSSMSQLGDLAADFIDTVIEEPCDVIGHSFGGWVAAWLAVRHPAKVRHLVLSAPAGFRPEGVGGLGGDPESLRQRMFAHPENLPPEPKPPAVLRQNRELAHRYSGGVATDNDLVPLLPKIASETLLLLGSKDGIIPAESVHLLRRKIPHSHLIYVHDAAHSIDTDQPDRFAQVVADFLARGEAFVVNWRSQAAG